MESELVSPGLRRVLHMLYRIPGVRVFADRVRRMNLVDKWVLIKDFDGDLAFYCNLSDHMGSQIYWRGYYSPSQLMLLDKTLKPDMTFIDVGANHGEFSIFAAKRLPQGRVIAFEPSALIHERLLKNIAANHFKNVTAVKKGLWRETSSSLLYSSSESFADGSVNEGLGTLFPSETDKTNSESIDLVALDDFVISAGLERIDVIKIDIEGAELAALEGARETLQRFRPIIFIEVSEERNVCAGYQSSELLDFIGSMGYSFKLIGSKGNTKAISAQKLRPYQNIVCYPK